MEWKTIVCLLVALAAAAMGALLPATATVAGTVTGLALGMLVPQPKSWGKTNGAVEPPPSPEQDKTPLTVPNPTRYRSKGPRSSGLSNLELLLATALLGALLFILAKVAGN